MDLGLKGKKALVTGGSKGIGRATAELLASEGADVAICARNADEVSAAVEALKSKGVNAVGSAVDVGDGDAYKKWIESAIGELGGLDILVPNVSAGGGANIGSEEGWKANFEVDIMDGNGSQFISGTTNTDPQLIFTFPTAGVNIIRIRGYFF